MNKSIEKELKNWLEASQYDVWLTITFRNPIIIEGKEDAKIRAVKEAKKRYKRFFARINSPDQMFFEKRMKSLVFFERQKKQGLHIHALVKGIDKSLIPALNEMCNAYFGESVVKTVHEGVPGYLAKKYILNKFEDWEPLTIHSHSVRF